MDVIDLLKRKCDGPEIEGGSVRSYASFNRVARVPLTARNMFHELLEDPEDRETYFVL